MAEPRTKLKPKNYGHEYNPEESQIDAFSIELERKLTDSINQRSLIDQRFIDDMRLYHGEYSEEVQSELSKQDRSKVFMNLVRAKTDAGEAQLVDLLFQVDDKNWGISSTPKPDLVSKTTNNDPVEVNGQTFKYEDNGEPVVQGDIALREIEEATEKAAKMESLIDDQLVETDYSSKGRAVIHDACVVGSGIIKGPVIQGRLKRSYVTGEDGNQEVVVEERFEPSAEVVRPWDFFPDPSAATITECEYVYERRFMSRKDIRNLVFRKGFDKDQIRKVLGMKPKATQHTSGFLDDVRVLAGMNNELNDTRYELWEYHGPIEKEMLVEWGMEISDEDLEDPLKEVTGIVHYCGGIVLGVKVHLIDYDKSFPYRVFNWIPNDSSIFGFGIPHVTKDQQDVINSSVRMMLDNAAVTAGPQIGINRKRVKPINGEYKLTPFKFWDLDNNIQDIRQVFSTVEFNSHLPELQGIYSLARVLLDEVSGVPMLQQGEQGQSTPTLGGMSMLMNASNTVRRRQVKLWDDNITKPLIKDFYHYNMLFHEDESVKGDYQVQARGTSALLIKEQIAQSISNFLSVVGSSEVFQPVLSLKAREILEAWRKTQNLPAHLVPTEEEFTQFVQNQQQSQQQAKDPQERVEELRMEQLKAKHDHERAMFEQDKASEFEQKNMDRQLKFLQLQEQRENRVSQEKQELMRLAQQGKISQEKLMVELEKQKQSLKSEWAGKEYEAKLKMRYGKSGNYGVE